MGFWEDLQNLAEPAVKNAVSDAVKDALDKNKTPLPVGVQTITPTATVSNMDSFTMSLILVAASVLGGVFLFKKKAK